MSTALNSEYRKVITARYTDRPCHTCGGALVVGDHAATNDFKAWHSYCSRCATSHAAQIAGLLARVEAAVAPLGDDNVPATIMVKVNEVEPYIAKVLDGTNTLDTFLTAKVGLFQVLTLVTEAAKPKPTPDPLIDALKAIAAAGDRDSGFARSLLAGHAKYGSLTTNQRSAAERMIAERATQGPGPGPVQTAQAALPVPTVEVGLYRSDDGTVRRVYRTNRGHGRISCRKYNGRAFSYEGNVGLRFVADGIAAGTCRLLNAAEASAFGRQIGRCFNCLSIGRPGDLSDDRSLAVGYGETCANHNGWWYPTADEAAQILRGTMDVDAKLTDSLTTGAPLPVAPTEADLNERIAAAEAGESLIPPPLDEDDEYITEDEDWTADDGCPNCGRVLGTSNGVLTCDNCGWTAGPPMAEDEELGEALDDERDR